MKKAILIFTILISSLFALSREEIVKNYTHSLYGLDFEDAEEHLQEWEEGYPEDRPLIETCRALKDLATGKIEEFYEKVQELTESLVTHGCDRQEVSDIFDSVSANVKFAYNFPLFDYFTFQDPLKEASWEYHLCSSSKSKKHEKHKEPRGWLIRYCVGFAFVGGGLIFSCAGNFPSAIALIAVGTDMITSGYSKGESEMIKRMERERLAEELEKETFFKQFHEYDIKKRELEESTKKRREEESVKKRREEERG
jgi:hypothetical protein